MITELELTIRLVVACILGGIIGWERERLDRPAGFRTHILVCIGSTLIMILSINIYQSVQGLTNADPARLAAQVVSGIGFLGAGTILRDGFSVKGLTTAASLWVVSGIGLAIGAGLYYASCVGTVLVFVVLRGYVETFFFKEKHQLKVTIVNTPGKIGTIGNVLGSHGIMIRDISISDLPNDQACISLILRTPKNADMNKVVDDLHCEDGICKVEKTYEGR